MDIEERAQQHELAEWEARNKPRAPTKTFQPGEPGYGQAFCNCGEEVHPVRRGYGYNACTPCASALERRR